MWTAPGERDSRVGFRVVRGRVLADVGDTDRVVIPDLKLTLVQIKPGSFMMGSPANEDGRHDDERQHKVTLTQPYWLGQTEVTQSQYEAIMGKNPSLFHFKGADRPVESVSWNDAVKFCKKLTERERRAGRLSRGQVYRLPTEAEWEYACRAGSDTAYCFGDNAGQLDDYAWYGSNSGGQTHDVGRKKPNAWGLYDMHGNVWEWCSDWYDDDYPRGAVTDPTGPGTGSRRVDRGGSWSHTAGYCRSAYRGRDSPSGTSHSALGFRLARGAP
jgi:formylglycine-generating enzyme required for sulfatase activity